MFGRFIRPVGKVIKKIDKTGQVFASLAALQQKDVLAGIPQATSSREGEGPNNAELGYVLANGSPANHIPPRPFLQPAIESNVDQISAQQAKVVQDALDGKPVDGDMQKLGLLAQSKIKSWFTDPRNNWAPNAPATIARKGSDRPLIDTGALRNSISYVVRQKNATD